VAAACIATADGLDHVRIGQQAVAALLAVDPAPAAIFCLSDLIAYGARHALLARGRPDIVLMGFDDNPLNDVIAPWLSSVRIPYERFGAAVAAAIERLAAGEAASETLLPYALICRT
jgi:LacI family transcriptional regulator